MRLPGMGLARCALGALLLVLAAGACAGGEAAPADGNAPVDLDGRAPLAGNGGNGGAAPRGGTGSNGGRGGGTPGREADTSSDWVFDESALRTYELTLDPSAWEALQRNARDEQYTEADLQVEGRSLPRVGLRFKGSLGTLASCFTDDGRRTCSKLSMKLKFSEYVPEQRFFGLKRLNFNSMLLDASQLRERLAYRLFREVGLAAPRATHAILVVNGEALGVFSLVEDVDGRFTDAHFDGGDGNLYKEAWPDTADVSFLTAQLETNEERPDHTVLLQFRADLGAADSEELPAVVARYMDLEGLAAHLAVSRTIRDWDGVATFYCYDGGDCANHNYFLYQHEEEPRFSLIPWDLDNTFREITPLDGVPELFQIPDDCSVRYPAFGKAVMPAACDPLLRGFVLGGRGAYRAALERLLNGPFLLPNLERWVAAWQAQLEPAVAEDTHGPGPERFHASLEELRGELEALRERALGELGELR